MLSSSQLPRQMNAYYTYLRFDTTGRAANRKRGGLAGAGRQACPALSAPIVQQAINRARNLRAFANSTAERLTDHGQKFGPVPH